MPLTFNAIFLGNSTTLIDPFEGDTDAERANLLVGQTFGTTSRWLAGQWVSFTSVNIGGKATALDQNNNVVNDQATITRDGVSTTFTFDGTAIYNVRITYGDGSQSALVPLVVVQMTNGDLYAVPSPPQARRPTRPCRQSRSGRSSWFRCPATTLPGWASTAPSSPS